MRSISYRWSKALVILATLLFTPIFFSEAGVDRNITIRGKVKSVESKTIILEQSQKNRSVIVPKDAFHGQNIRPGQTVAVKVDIGRVVALNKSR